jgi:uridylate kinase
MMKIALKVGGSVFCPDKSPDMGFVGRLAKTLKGLASEHEIVVVVGGGHLARWLISEARKRGVSFDDELHVLGIEAARKNAAVLMKALGEGAFHEVAKNEEEVRKAAESGKIVVAGGFRPGQTTDAVTLQCAQAVGADLVVIGTDVKGVYNRDPKQDKHAKFISMISVSQLMELVKTESVEPGAKTVIDPVAVSMIEKTGIRAVVVNIKNMENLENAVEGREFEGTVIE